MMISTVLVSAGLRSVVLDIEAENAPSLRLAERLGADRRSPTRVERDGTGTARTLVAHVLSLDCA
jgi:RimJ/RimL family protein N-acetyltransferase